MRIHNLYTDENGESHFRDIEVEWEEERNFSKYSRKMPATGIIFRETSGDYDLDWHPAPRRQYIVNLDVMNRLNRSKMSIFGSKLKFFVVCEFFGARTHGFPTEHCSRGEGGGLFPCDVKFCGGEEGSQQNRGAIRGFSAHGLSEAATM